MWMKQSLTIILQIMQIYNYTKIFIIFEINEDDKYFIKLFIRINYRLEFTFVDKSFYK
jgi:hypothetical protein